MKAHEIKENESAKNKDLTPEEELKIKQIALKRFIFDLVNESLDTEFPQSIISDFKECMGNTKIDGVDDTVGTLLMFEIIKQGIEAELNRIYFSVDPDDIIAKVEAMATKNETSSALDNFDNAIS